MTRISVLYMFCLIMSMTVISCDRDYEENVCTCPHGGTIGGWTEPDDTTSIHQNDTTGGFEVILEDWGNSETHDISI